MRPAYIAFVTLSLALSATAHAHNSYFLPGDAFFHFVLTEAKLDQIDTQESPVVEYNRPDFLPDAFCGYAGFARLQYVEMPREMKKHLRSVYDKLRESIPKRVEITDEVVTQRRDGMDVDVPTGKKLHREVNGFHVLFYNGSFNREKFRFGLKYNESWADDVANFGHRRDHVHLESFVRKPDAIAEDWRDGADVKPLKAVCPESSPKKIGEPIRVERDVHALVIPFSDFERLYRGEEDAFGGLSIFDISAAGIKVLTAKHGHWIERQAPKGFGPSEKSLSSTFSILDGLCEPEV